MEKGKYCFNYIVGVESEKRKFWLAGEKESWINITTFMLDVAYNCCISVVSHMKIHSTVCC